MNPAANNLKTMKENVFIPSSDSWTSRAGVVIDYSPGVLTKKSASQNPLREHNQYSQDANISNRDSENEQESPMHKTSMLKAQRFENGLLQSPLSAVDQMAGEYEEDYQRFLHSKGLSGQYPDASPGYEYIEPHEERQTYADESYDSTHDEMENVNPLLRTGKFTHGLNPHSENDIRFRNSMETDYHESEFSPANNSVERSQRTMPAFLDVDLSPSNFNKAIRFGRPAEPHLESLETKPMGTNEEMISSSGPKQALVTGGNEDLFEQQQAREQSHVLQRFKQLRAWQQQQQEFLMRQQQQQLEMLKSEQDRVNKMIVRQREMQWGGKGSPTNAKVASPMSTPPRTSRQLPSSLPTALAHGAMVLARNAQPQPTILGEKTATERNTIFRPVPSIREEGSTANFDQFSDLDSNAEELAEDLEEGVFPLPETASETSEPPYSMHPIRFMAAPSSKHPPQVPNGTSGNSIGQHRTLMKTLHDKNAVGLPYSTDNAISKENNETHAKTMHSHKFENQPTAESGSQLEQERVRQEEERLAVKELNSSNIDDIPILPGLGASKKTFEQLLEEELRKEEEKLKKQPVVASPGPAECSKKTFLKRGQGLARFGGSQKAPIKTTRPSVKPTQQHWSPAGPKAKTLARKVASKSPVQHPILKLELKPSPAKQKSAITKTTVAPSDRQGDTSMDISFQMKMQEKEVKEKVDKKELEEFELLEQYAENNTSFCSTVSTVERILAGQPTRQGRQKPSEDSQPSTLQDDRRAVVAELNNKDVDDTLSDSSDSDSDSDSDLETTANDITLKNDDDEEEDDVEDGNNMVDVEERERQGRVQRKVASEKETVQFAALEPNNGVHMQDRGRSYHEDAVDSEGGDDSEDGGEDGDRDDREEPEESTGMTSSHTNHEEFKDEEEWGDLSRYHRSSESDESIIAGATPLITSTPPPYRTQGHSQIEAETAREPTPPPTSKLVAKLFPKLKPKEKKPSPLEQKQEEELQKASSTALGEGVQSKLLREKLAELESEVDRFRKENSILEKLRAEREDGLQKLKKEIEEFEKQKNEELKRLQEFKTQETKKLKKEKKLFEQHRKEALVKPDKKERQEIENLKQELSELQDEVKRKESRWTASATRLRNRVEQLETENDELRDELKIMEKRRLEAWQKEQSKKIKGINESLGKPQKLVSEEYNDHEVKNLPLKATLKPPQQEPKNMKMVPEKLEKRKSKVEDTGPKPPSNIPVSVPKYSSNDVIHKEEKTPSPRHTALAPESQTENPNDLHGNIEKPIPRKRAVRFNMDAAFDKDDQYEEVKHTDGKVERIYTTGARQITFPNGTRKQISADGQSIIVSFFNGDMKQILPDQRVVYYYADVQTTHSTYPDGLEILQFLNGQVEKHYPDGTNEITFPDQTIKYLFPDGREESIFHDGTVIRVEKNGDKTMEFPTGQREIHTQQYKRREYPDGTVKTVYPDGNQETRYANGRVRIKDKNGHIIVDKKS